jgi:hypothetical protein
MNDSLLLDVQREGLSFLNFFGLIENCEDRPAIVSKWKWNFDPVVHLLLFLL